jgi:hypothetical protein
MKNVHVTPAVAAAVTIVEQATNAPFSLYNWDHSETNVTSHADGAYYLQEYLTHKMGMENCKVTLTATQLEVIATQSVHFMAGASFGVEITPRRAVQLFVELRKHPDYPRNVLVELTGSIARYLPITKEELQAFMQDPHKAFLLYGKK